MTRVPSDPPADPAAPQSARADGGQSSARRRDDLRKAALKANLARRKAQIRGRRQAAAPADAESPDTDTAEA